MSFKPSQFKHPFDISKIILKEKPQSENVPVDVLFVGAGPSGLSGAIRLAQRVQKEKSQNPNFPDIEIGVLEKGEALGEHSLSGAVLNPIGFQKLFPDLNDKDFPFRGKVTDEDVFWLRNQKTKIKIPTPPTMKNHGHYYGSLSEMVRWLGEKAESLGVNIFTNFPAESLLVKDNTVQGVRTVPAGLGRDGQKTSQFMPPTDITAQITVLSEGTRSPITQAYMKWQSIEPHAPQIYALGVKEIWQVKKDLKKIIHTMGWPLPNDAFGGSFAYPMGKNKIAIGLVVGLDYKQSNLDTHKLLQTLKTHSYFSELLTDGELLEWGAKTIPEGGFYSLPQRLHGDGLLITGDAAGMVNVPALKGIHYAMISGITAADVAFEALQVKDTSSKTLKKYDEKIKKSFIFKDLKKVKSMRPAFKSGLYMGGLKSALMTVTRGTFPNIEHHEGDDEVSKCTKDKVTYEKNHLAISKADAVYQSGNKTRDDIPQHLKVGKDIPKEVAEFYSALCPAGVYEIKDEKLIVNSPNCVDCKATDVLGPEWSPREGGSGTKYKEM